MSVLATGSASKKIVNFSAPLRSVSRSFHPRWLITKNWSEELIARSRQGSGPTWFGRFPMLGWNIDIFTKVTRLQREPKQAERVTCGSSGSTVAWLSLFAYC
ncbi:autophagy-related protein 101 [Platysternon megacephalum]|uniref:Autophagy-related protein 101 n=1 Tax=Platysternon megacephalum TaxID=55544 RepID=A0A4D9E8B6_9SAUR|nr:autophagy-related protein 101 [Platysternon megacephalum]